MSKRILDLPVPLQAGIAFDPPGLRPQIDCLDHGASQLGVHPWPITTPRESEADRQLTRRVAEAARLLQIHFLDHVICGRRGFFSFKGAGLL